MNRALGKLEPSLGPPLAGGSPFVTALIGRLGHPNALVRRLLLNVLTSIYERHQQPKQLVMLHQLIHAQLNAHWRPPPPPAG